ncbi:MAG: hypothetical protein GXY87_07730 [Tissierellia bacterium]|nr:hypothetical protein [Tissierellia bacterium]
MKNTLIHKYKHYTKLLEILEDRKEDVEGVLVLSKSHANTQYYLRTTDNKTGNTTKTYIPVQNMDMIKRLAQNQYHNKLKKLLLKRLKQISSILKDYDDFELENVYDSYLDDRKKLLVPLILTYDMKVEKWLSKHHTPLPPIDGDFVITTKNGELVKSKSEKILADTFYDYGIKYKYECPLTLDSGHRIYPDFTFISPYTHEEIYWEHFGMIDKEDYSLNTIRKLELYQLSNIFLGQRLIVTFESSKTNLNYEIVYALIKKYLLRED